MDRADLFALNLRQMVDRFAFKSREAIAEEAGVPYVKLSRWITQGLSQIDGKSRDQLNRLVEVLGMPHLKDNFDELYEDYPEWNKRMDTVFHEYAAERFFGDTREGHRQLAQIMQVVQELNPDVHRAIQEDGTALDWVIDAYPSAKNKDDAFSIAKPLIEHYLERRREEQQSARQFLQYLQRNQRGLLDRLNALFGSNTNEVLECLAWLLKKSEEYDIDQLYSTEQLVRYMEYGRDNAQNPKEVLQQFERDMEQQRRR